MKRDAAVPKNACQSRNEILFRIAGGQGAVDKPTQEPAAHEIMWASMKTAVEYLLEELNVTLGAMYGSHLKGLCLYGSHARDEEADGSDADILVVLDHFDRYGEEVDRTSALIASLSLTYGVSISKVFIQEPD